MVQAALSADRRTDRLVLRQGTVVARGQAITALTSGPSGVVAVQLLQTPEAVVVSVPDLTGPLESRIGEVSSGRRLSEVWVVWWPALPLSCDPASGSEDGAVGEAGILLRFSGAGDHRETTSGQEVSCG